MSTPEHETERTPGAATERAPDHIPAQATDPTTEPVPPAGATPPPEPAGPAQKPLRHTRLSGTWVAVIVAVIVLIFLLIFILQNLDEVTVNFLGTAATLPLGVALLFSAVGGALLVVLIGSARIMPLRRATRKAHAARSAAHRP